jgi:hypothetical protein
VLDELLPGKEVAQTFRCSEANLSAIAVKAALRGRPNTCSLELSLYEEGNDAPVQTLRQSALEASENGWLVFRFPPVEASTGRSYRFVVSSPDAKPGAACELVHARETLYREGTLQANGRSGKGALVFQTFVERSNPDRVRELIKPERAGYSSTLALEGGVGLESAFPSGREPQSGLRDEIRSLRRRMERMEQRQTDVSLRVTDIHNFFSALRGSLPYRVLRKIARTLRLRPKR